MQSCKITSIFITLFGLLISFSVNANNEAIDELELFFDDEELIEIASNQLQSADKAPAIVTVITGKEVRKSGARDLYDILARVPGFGVSISRYGLMMSEVRGIKTINSEKIKFLIDGHSVNDVLYNSFSWGFNQISLDNIKRIEIIRGPGSALHGSSAVVGVINVVTKDAEDIDGVIVTAGGGEFDTQRINIQVGKKFNNYDMSYFFDAIKTDGPQRSVSPDAIGNSGMTNLRNQRIDTGLKIKYQDFIWNSRYINRDETGYIGMVSALGDDNVFKSTHFFSELNYTKKISNDLSFSATGFVDLISKDNFVELYPEGFDLHLPTGEFLWTYEDGMKGNPNGKSRIVGAEAQVDYLPMDNQLLTVGARFEKHSMHDIKHISNFDPATFIPLTSLQDNSKDGNFLDTSNLKRYVAAFYVQDVISITKEMDITLGVRHDQYSDFGGTTNPRAAFVWRLLRHWDIKALYGTAFRAPTFTEQYNDNNPVIKGNDNLEPETVKTAELSLGFKFNNFLARTSYFHNTIDDKILPDPILIRNKGGAKVQGIEFEGELRWNNIARLYGNYTFQNAEDNDTGTVLPDVSKHKANAGADISLGRYLDINFNIFKMSSRPRAAGDNRSPVPGYNLLDIALIGKSFYPGLEIRASIFNVLNEDYVDPSLPDGVPNDHPRAGRSYMLDVTYRL